MLIPFTEVGATEICEHKICVEFTNFIFDEDSGEFLLSANVSIFKYGKLMTVCEYADRFTVGRLVECSKIVGGMDWALKMFGEFIARCVDINCASAGDDKIFCETSPEVLVEDQKSGESIAAKVSQKTDAFPRIINISARGEAYIVVDSEDGTKRYFSGRLFNGSSVNVKCDSPYRIISTNDELIEVK
jgi:hypothetical protein